LHEKNAERAVLKKEYRQELMADRVEEIRQLEQEKKDIQDRLKEKEKELYRFKFKIKDLQKTKQVLTHTT
jgi:hypothetical protein